MENIDIKKIKALIAEGKTKEAISILVSQTFDTRYHDNAIHISNKFNVLQDKIMKGLLSSDEIFVENAKVSNSIIELLSLILENIANKNPLTSRRRFNNILSFVALSLAKSLPFFIIIIYVDVVHMDGYSFNEFVLITILFILFYIFTFPVVASFFAIPVIDKACMRYPKFNSTFPPLFFLGLLSVFIVLINNIFNNIVFSEIIIPVIMLLYISSYVFIIFRTLKTD